jgi:hypothetical protein
MTPKEFVDTAIYVCVSSWIAASWEAIERDDQDVRSSVDSWEETFEDWLGDADYDLLADAAAQLDVENATWKQALIDLYANDMDLCIEVATDGTVEVPAELFDEDGEPIWRDRIQQAVLDDIKGADPYNNDYGVLIEDLGRESANLVLNAMREAIRNAVFDDDIQKFCEINRIEPYEREVYEYWLVSEWGARRLQEVGEYVGDIYGCSVWHRTTTGQAISMDYCIQEICK